MDARSNLEVGTGVSQGALAFDVAAQATTRALSSIQTHPLSIVVVYASVAYDLSEVLRGVRSVVGDIPVIGATTAGEICHGAQKQSVVVSIWASPHLAVHCSVGRAVSKDSRHAVEEALCAPSVSAFFSNESETRQRLTREGKSVFAVLFAPGNTRRHDSKGFEILGALKIASEHRFPIFAAAAADDWRMEENFVLCGPEAIPDGLLLAIFETRLQFGIALTHGFRPLSATASVTAASQQELIAIDGRPAADELPKLLGSTRAELEGKHVSLTSGRTVGVRNGMGQYNIVVSSYLTATGGCRLAQPVKPGTVLTVMEPDPNSMRLAASEAMRKAILRGGITKPAIAMVSYCALRERFMGRDSALEEISAMTSLLGDTPVFGFFSFGEGGVCDDGVSRYSNSAVSALVIGAEFTPAAHVALECERLRREIEIRADDLETEVAERTAALEASEERFQLAMRGANDGVWDRNLKTGKGYLSPRWKSMLGYEDDEIDDCQDNWSRLIHPDDLRAALARRRACIENKGKYEIEYRMRHKAGHYVDILSRAIPVTDENGQVVRLVGTHVDISERKNVERTLREAAAVLKSTAEGVVITTASGRITSVNPAFSAITGYAEADVLLGSMQILHSGRQGPDFYRDMWRTIQDVGSWQGEIWNRRKSGEIYPQWLTISALRDSSEQVVNYVGVFSDITLLKHSEKRLEHIAHHDALTDLPNRLLLSSRLEHAIARAKRGNAIGALLFVDLDRFKNVNDSLGHSAGDELLVHAVRRFQQQLQPADMLARLGGDEFVVVLEDLPHPEDAGRTASELIGALSSRPFEVAGKREVFLGASIGVSLFPSDGDTPEELIQHADSALYEAKDGGRGTYRFYSSALTVAANKRVEMEAMLRRALERNEFFVEFQPIVSLQDGRMVGVEALVRWRHGEFGVIAPIEFIPLAEETGLIDLLGEWVLRTACARMKVWLTAGAPLEFIAVNLSPRQFQTPDIHVRVRNVLEDTGLPAACLALEFTESAMMQQGEVASLKIAALKALGVRLAIDDFGTGYSSLAYLKHLPIDKLKIDRSFIQGIPDDNADMSIVAAIVVLAKNLGLSVVAEGVETQAQHDALTRAGCDLAQGYLFGRPMSEEALLSLLGVVEDGRSSSRAR